MRPVPKQRRGVTPRARLRVLQLPVVLWLTLVWVALWGELSAANVVFGLVVSIVVCLVFPLPTLPMDLHIRPLRLVWLVLRFLGDVVVASVEVAWITLRFWREPRNAVIEVDLETSSDFVLTVVAEMVSLVPGSLVVEARRSTHTLFLHVLDARDTAGVDKMRSQVYALERRVVRALGTETQRLPEGGTP
ncbi:Na+/H+ antiporter subunit E [Nocardioides soli]|uniref:Multicomponent Na+:H+ antiporter subunit E n=1 Tax=Nocardioides soli TaxID=1036020 RepID=A0A7W4VXH1_9ACTN|nr:Na+/H+ antiporter subunit E [Nocardioides soli]MBB3043582.1 multicomponent Na+:H+ antiporter subunit E [Nocardioides soli]